MRLNKQLEARSSELSTQLARAAYSAELTVGEAERAAQDAVAAVEDASKTALIEVASAANVVSGGVVTGTVSRVASARAGRKVSAADAALQQQRQAQLRLEAAARAKEEVDAEPVVVTPASAAPGAVDLASWKTLQLVQHARDGEASVRVVGFAALRRWRNKAAAGAGLCCSYVGAGLSRVTGRAAAAAVAAPLAEGYAGGVDDLYNSWAAASSAGRLGRARRTVDIWATVCRLAWRQRTLLRRYAADDAAALSAARRQLGADAREALLALGPTFIKLGQLLSTRVDILPREYIEELSLLQDNVPGFSGDVAARVIEEELGAPPEELFDTFSREPFAAASLGQVHRATRRGKELVVKVQRLGLRELFAVDLANLRTLVRVLDALDKSDDGTKRDWTAIYDQSAKLLYKEIDYEAEAQNGLRFRDNFRNRPWIKVPDFYEELTTQRVVTMEYVPGIKISDVDAIEAAGIDRRVLSRHSAEAYLEQLCRHGFFHCDPHPGNMACDPKEGGRLIYYDFGMMDVIPTATRKAFVDFVFAIYANEPKLAVDAAERMGVFRPGLDRLSVERLARVYLDEFGATMRANPDDATWIDDLPEEERRTLRRAQRARIAQELFVGGGGRSAEETPFLFPPAFTFVFRAFTSLDGIGKGLDSSYDLTRIAQPYLRELADLRDGSKFISAVKLVGKKVGLRPVDISAAITQPRRVAAIDDVVVRLEQGDLKLRVRALETERALLRLERAQSNQAFGLSAAALVNTALVLQALAALSPTGAATALATRAALAGAGVCGAKLALGVRALRRLEQDEVEARKERKGYGLSSASAAVQEADGADASSGAGSVRRR